VPRQNIREFIVDQFKHRRKPLTLNEIARRMNMSRANLEEKLRKSQPLSHGRGLTPEKASTVIKFYGKCVIFNAELEWLIAEGEKSAARLKQFGRKSQRITRKPAK
jgi:hypothetical protein